VRARNPPPLARGTANSHHAEAARWRTTVLIASVETWLTSGRDRRGQRAPPVWRRRYRARTRAGSAQRMTARQPPSGIVSRARSRATVSPCLTTPARWLRTRARARSADRDRGLTRQLDRSASGPAAVGPARRAADHRCLLIRSSSGRAPSSGRDLSGNQLSDAQDRDIQQPGIEDGQPDHR
jgi:hypothetical protein